MNTSDQKIENLTNVVYRLLAKIEKIESKIRGSFDLRPRGIIEDMDLLRPIYTETSAYGHFGRENLDFGWEKTDIL